MKTEKKTFEELGMTESYVMAVRPFGWQVCYNDKGEKFAIRQQQTFEDLKTGDVITYNDAANVDAEYIVTGKGSDQFGAFVNVMNTETKFTEPISVRTVLGNRWTLKNK